MQYYYYYYNPNTKTKGDPLTWEQLLYSFYKGASKQKIHVWSHYEEDCDPFNPYAIEAFFGKLGHSDKDGWWEDPRDQHRYSWWYHKNRKTEVVYEFKTDFIGPILPKHMYKYMVKKIVDVTPEPKKVWKIRTRIMDSYGRIIPVGFLKAEYKRFKPDTSKPKEDKRKYYWRRTGTSYYQKGHGWHRYAGDHAGFTSWKRDWYYHRILKREVLEEYGTTFKLSDKIPYPYQRTRQRGWKRTRKRKQWM